ncbi:MAG: Si-specific NAD(P)(+) transhydrogenase [Gammaproteobacteria bacterium]|nr:Si-specific NAD(P)(+) transhydrogenase [Gammaproteobacteria bacterium]
MGSYDVFVIGSGPAGQKAAIQAAKGGRKVAVCEQLKEVGGACVHQGTIPSKALRERAFDQAKAVARLQSMNIADPGTNVGVAALIGEMGDVIKAHDVYMTEQLERNGIDVIHGRASFVDDRQVNVRKINGQVDTYTADYYVIASGSKPRLLDHVPVDHEFIYDSDSILSLAYLPQSLVVLGGGVIACEYASIFALLGVKVTLIDRFPQPLGFLDPDLTKRFLESFEHHGGSFIGEADVESVQFDGISRVETHFSEGTVVKSDKVLCALGRVSQLDGLKVENAGVVVNEKQLVEVGEAGQTSVPHIYAVGDVVGPPSLASASMEQGRRAACAILGLNPGRESGWIPTGIYAVPEMASVGLTEAQASEAHGDVVIGYADFSEIARGHIANSSDGLLKLIVSADRVVRGIHIVGTQATDLIHIGQMGLLQNATVDVYVENVFNFPTYAETYRVAALQAAARLAARGAGESERVA